MPDLGTILGALRPLIPILAAAIAHWGFGTDAQNTTIITAVFGAAMTIWGAQANSQNAKIASVNASNNGVRVVDENKAIAVGIPPVATSLK